MGGLLKRVFKLGVLAGAGYAVWRFFDSRRSESAVSWEPQPVPFPPKPRVAPMPVATAPVTEQLPAPLPITEPMAQSVEPIVDESGDDSTDHPSSAIARAEPATPVDMTGVWVEPIAGTCPEGYPVKAKMASGIYHVKGGMSYGRTTPDRCYRDAESAEADGLRPAKR